MPIAVRKKTYREYCQEIIAQYIEAGNAWPATMRAVARWAIRNSLWQRHAASDVQLCARDLSKAAREEYYTDPQGRRVRKKHAFRKSVETATGLGQMTFWTDIQAAAPEDMQLALQQRRFAVLSDCRQLKIDADSYNDNNPHGAEVQLAFNFEEDLAEMEQPTEYPDQKPN